MMEVAAADEPSDGRTASPTSRPQSDPALQPLIDGMAMLDRLDSDLARFERELGGMAPPGT